MTTVEDDAKGIKMDLSTVDRFSGIAIRRMPFDGKEKSWEEWSTKTRLLSEERGWWKAINPDFKYKKDSPDPELVKNKKINHTAYTYDLLGSRLSR